ncbi:DUF4376 domain-containing protein [Intestinimonas massiliensis (ex Afouda et al. 2020)]|uniref:DUF4376 domain-containing protein n=1 Tax=Intestinimonas massiliensis (ex Afouda et al. 2020) TaxID=1673721 RepID=A0ABS9MD79_9FIRM|nr:hypothetical protein [Intestinimonas massiliensis (ex Afouda et al. 2020)]MCG4528774.1 hypothetical protein [Intestinimonas massiliensis (ex Afouda et al. 2020)]
MKIIRMTANPSGAWPPIQEGAFDVIPEGHALVPDSLDLAAFYAAVGFVVPTFSEVGAADEMPSHMAMTGYTVAQEALDAWIASHPAPDPLEAAQSAKLSELSAACNAAIVAGCDVTLSTTKGHISLTDEDQINLTTAVGAVQQGSTGYPYHLDGQLCAIYPAADIIAIGEAATAHKLYHTTYCNHLFAWVRRCDTFEGVSAITYGSTLPEDLAANMTAILEAASNA